MRTLRTTRSAQVLEAQVIVIGALLSSLARLTHRRCRQTYLCVHGLSRERERETERETARVCVLERVLMLARLGLTQLATDPADGLGRDRTPGFVMKAVRFWAWQRIAEKL
jgi:hypothetical protein